MEIDPLMSRFQNLVAAEVTRLKHPMRRGSSAGPGLRSEQGILRRRDCRSKRACLIEEGMAGCAVIETE